MRKKKDIGLAKGRKFEYVEKQVILFSLAMLDEVDMIFDFLMKILRQQIFKADDIFLNILMNIFFRKQLSGARYKS